MNALPLIIGGLGPIELGIILIVLVLLFGASRLPELARSVGLSMGEFEKGRREVEQELEAARKSASGDESDPEEPETLQSES